MGEGKRRTSRIDWSQCAYCGKPATGRDHVPPKCLFPKDRINLIAVPSCDAHNNKKSNLDQKFMEFVGLSTAEKERRHPLLARAIKSLNRNPRRKSDILQRAIELPKHDVVAVTLEADIFIGMINSIARGLYWFHTGTMLPASSRVEVQRLDPAGEYPFLQTLTHYNVANRQFVYTFDILSDHPTVAFIMFQFHSGLLGIAITDADLADRFFLYAG